MYGGCAMAGALIAARTLKKGDLMVVLIPDTGERYLSKVYDEDWLRRNQLLESGIDLNVGPAIRDCRELSLRAGVYCRRRCAQSSSVWRLRHQFRIGGRSQSWMEAGSGATGVGWGCFTR